MLRRGGNPPAPAFPGGETGKGRSSLVGLLRRIRLTSNMNARRYTSYAFLPDYGSEAAFHLMSVILLYGSQQKIRLATVHAPESNPNGGPPLLGAGQPVSRQFLHQLSCNLQSELPATWLPEHVLIWSQRLVAWWEPARLRPMFFSPESDGKTLDGKLYPHPPLLFAIRDRHLFVWALAEDTRPKPNTPLLQAPYWNTSPDGAVCHSNLGRTLCRHREGFLGMWRDLAGRKRFPIEYLIPKKTLRETFCQNSSYIE